MKEFYKCDYCRKKEGKILFKVIDKRLIPNDNNLYRFFCSEKCKEKFKVGLVIEEL